MNFIPLLMIMTNNLGIIMQLPPGINGEGECHVVHLLAIIQMFLIIVSYCTYPSNGSNLPSYRRLFPSNAENNDEWSGRDVFSMFSEHRREFWFITCETPETFTEMLRNIYPNMFSEHRRRAFTLSPRNRLLMTLIWLRHYPTYTMLSLMFNISTTSVGEILEHTWMTLWEVYAQRVRWHSVTEWQRLIGIWSEMPYVVGVIDGTSHEIEIPANDQEVFYSGHRKYHCIHTQVVIDNERNIVYVHSGFCGHQNDVTAFNSIPGIGPGLTLDFLDNVRLLADAIYPNRYPLITPYKSVSIRNQPATEQRKRRKLNRKLRSRRVYVEHIIKEVKLFKVIGSVYRHPRFFLSNITELCAGLAKRKIDMLRET